MSKYIVAMHVNGKVSYEIFDKQLRAFNSIPEGLRIADNDMANWVDPVHYEGHYDQAHVVECESGQNWVFYRTVGCVSYLVREQDLDESLFDRELVFKCGIYIP